MLEKTIEYMENYFKALGHNAYIKVVSNFNYYFDVMLYYCLVLPFYLIIYLFFGGGALI